jgi:hypothetical protein
MVAVMENSTVHRQDFRDGYSEERHHRRPADCYDDLHHRRREDWDHRPHYWPNLYWGPSLLDLAIDKSLLVGAAVLQRAPYLGFRLAELAEAAVLTPLFPWRAEEEWGPEWCRPEHRKECGPEWCRPEHRKECGPEWCRPEHRKECWPEWRRPEHRYEKRTHHRRSVDIRIESRQADVRSKVILVENNSPRKVTVTPKADPWMDASGATFDTTITFAPPSLDLEPGEAKVFTATVTVPVPPLAGGVAYFTRIHLEGSSARPISVELSVVPQGRVDVLALTDPCRPRRSGFVEFCEERIEERCERPRHRRFDPCFPRPEPWGPWHWRGYDPWRFWDRPRHWERLWLAPPLGVRCP